MLTTETFGKERFVALDFMRGAVALVVALAHFKAIGGYHIPPMADGLAVGYFFILSGFVLSHAYASQITSGEMGFRRFVVARIARLYPLQLLTFVLVAVFWGLVTLAIYAGLPLGLRHDWSIAPIIENLTMTHLMFSGRVSYNTPSWSIGVEFWAGMLIFALFALRNMVLRAALIAVVLIIGLANLSQGGLIFANQQYAFGWIEKNYAAGFMLFLFGWATWQIYLRVSSRLPAGYLGWGLAAVIFALVIWPPLDPVQVPYQAGFYYLLIILNILLLCRCEVRGVGVSRAMVWLGDISYGIYLWHIPVMLGLVALCRLILMGTGLDMTGAPLLVAIYILLVLGVATLGHHKFERPAKKWIKARFVS